MIVGGVLSDKILSKLEINIVKISKLKIASFV